MGGVQVFAINVKLYLLCPAAIKDPLIRSFLKKDDAFGAFRKYVEQTEDKELEGKVLTVMNYLNRIPELVTRLNGCSESNFHNAGTCQNAQHPTENLRLYLQHFCICHIPNNRNNLNESCI